MSKRMTSKRRTIVPPAETAIIDMLRTCMADCTGVGGRAGPVPAFPRIPLRIDPLQVFARRRGEDDAVLGCGDLTGDPKGADPAWRLGQPDPARPRVKAPLRAAPSGEPEAAPAGWKRRG